MHTLIIRHTADNRFRVMRLEDGKTAPETELTPPDAVAVPGRPDSHLLADLTWYLEQFLDYPFPPSTELAERIQGTLRDWCEHRTPPLLQRVPRGEKRQDKIRNM